MSRVLRGCLWLSGSVAAFGAVLCSSVARPVPLPPGQLPFVGNAVVRDLDADDSEPWSVMILADVQNGFPYLPRLFRQKLPQNLRAIVSVGDFSADPDEAHMRLPVAELLRAPPPVPFFIVPGNHDIRDGEQNKDCFLRWFGATTFEFRIGNTCFLGADNSDGLLDGQALLELEQKMTAATASGHRIILCMHCDIIDWQGKQKPGVEGPNRKLLEIVSRHDVRFVFSGHYHQAHDETRNRTRFVIAPASGHRDQQPGQNPISYLILRWNGESYLLERRQFCRRNLTELAGKLRYYWTLLGSRRESL